MADLAPIPVQVDRAQRYFDNTQFRSLSDVPEDGRLIRVLCRGGECPLTDEGHVDRWQSVGYAPPVDLNGDDEWHIVGWSWHQDRFTEAMQPPSDDKNSNPLEVIGWLPFTNSAA